MYMRAEAIKNILAGVAMDFIESQAVKREVFLYDKDVEADGLFPLSVNRCIKVTFEYTDAPVADKESTEQVVDIALTESQVAHLDNAEQLEQQDQ